MHINTERQAFFEFSQIALLITSLVFETYAFTVDKNWSHNVEKHKTYEICLFLMKKVDSAEHKKFIDAPSGPSDYDFKDDKAYFKRTIHRGSSEERASIGLITVSIVLLICHLITSCVSKDYSYRTKWTAAVQGIVIFSLGFAAMFLAISAHTLDTNYRDLASKFPECILLHACFNEIYKSDEKTSSFLETFHFKNSTSKLQKVLSQEFVCQEFQIKIVVAMICGIMILFCFVIICNAMDLTTLYDEEDVDEDERKRREKFHKHALRAKRKTHLRKNNLQPEEDSTTLVAPRKSRKSFKSLPNVQPNV